MRKKSLIHKKRTVLIIIISITLTFNLQLFSGLLQYFEITPEGDDPPEKIDKIDYSEFSDLYQEPNIQKEVISKEDCIFYVPECKIISYAVDLDYGIYTKYYHPDLNNLVDFNGVCSENLEVLGRGLYGRDYENEPYKYQLNSELIVAFTFHNDIDREAISEILVEFLIDLNTYAIEGSFSRVATNIYLYNYVLQNWVSFQSKDLIASSSNSEQNYRDVVSISVFNGLDFLKEGELQLKVSIYLSGHAGYKGIAGGSLYMSYYSKGFYVVSNKPFILNSPVIDGVAFRHNFFELEFFKPSDSNVDDHIEIKLFCNEIYLTSIFLEYQDYSNSPIVSSKSNPFYYYLDNILSNRFYNFLFYEIWVISESNFCLEKGSFFYVGIPLKLFFDGSEPIFPVKDLFFDGDSEVWNNYDSYKNDPAFNIDNIKVKALDNRYFLKELVPFIGMINVSEDFQYVYISLAFYYPYNFFEYSFNVDLLGLDHMHDLEVLKLYFVRNSDDHFNLERIACSQHNWVNSYYFRDYSLNSVEELLIWVAKDSHGMLWADYQDFLGDSREPISIKPLYPENYIPISIVEEKRYIKNFGNDIGGYLIDPMAIAVESEIFMTDCYKGSSLKSGFGQKCTYRSFESNVINSAAYAFTCSELFCSSWLLENPSGDQDNRIAPLWIRSSFLNSEEFWNMADQSAWLNKELYPEAISYLSGLAALGITIFAAEVVGTAMVELGSIPIAITALSALISLSPEIFNFLVKQAMDLFLKSTFEFSYDLINSKLSLLLVDLDCDVVGGFSFDGKNFTGLLNGYLEYNNPFSALIYNSYHHQIYASLVINNTLPTFKIKGLSHGNYNVSFLYMNFTQNSIHAIDLINMPIETNQSCTINKFNFQECTSFNLSQTVFNLYNDSFEAEEILENLPKSSVNIEFSYNNTFSSIISETSSSPITQITYFDTNETIIGIQNITNQFYYYEPVQSFDLYFSKLHLKLLYLRNFSKKCLFIFQKYNLKCTFKCTNNFANELLEKVYQLFGNNKTLKGLIFKKFSSISMAIEKIKILVLEKKNHFNESKSKYGIRCRINRILLKLGFNIKELKTGRYRRSGQLS